MKTFPLAMIAALAATSAFGVDPSPAQKVAAAQAAGLTVKGGKAYDDCDQPVDDIQIEPVDLNGDNAPEQIVTIGSPCYGNGGSLLVVLHKVGAGWVQVLNEPGIASVLKTSHGGWKDIEIGGPGMGKMPVARWNGSRYR